MCCQFIGKEAGIDEKMIEMRLILVATVITAKIGIVFIITTLYHFLSLISIYMMLLHNLLDAKVKRRENINMQSTCSSVQQKLRTSPYNHHISFGCQFQEHTLS